MEAYNHCSDFLFLLVVELVVGVGVINHCSDFLLRCRVGVGGGGGRFP